MLGKPAAFDITVTSPLNPSTFTEASVTAGSAALAAEQRKHNANDEKCSELGWKCVPLAVRVMGVGAQKLGSTWHDWLLVLLHATTSRSPRLPPVCTGDST